MYFELLNSIHTDAKRLVSTKQRNKCQYKHCTKYQLQDHHHKAQENQCYIHNTNSKLERKKTQSCPKKSYHQENNNSYADITQNLRQGVDCGIWPDINKFTELDLDI